MVVQPGKIGHDSDIVSGILAGCKLRHLVWAETFGFLHSVRVASSFSLTPLYLLHVKRERDKRASDHGRRNSLVM